MIHPTEMTKVSILGPTSRMPAVIERLHDLGVLHIDEYQEELDADIGDPAPEAEDLSDQLVRLRSLRSRLPGDGEPETAEQTMTVEELGERVEDIEDELDRIDRMREEKEALREKLAMAADLGLDLDAFTDYETLDIYLGTVDDTSFTDELEEGRYELFRSGDRIALFVDSDVDVDTALRNAGFERTDTADLMEREGAVEDTLDQLDAELGDLGDREDELREELADIGAAWRDELAEQEEELAEELEKAEAPLAFATTDSAFIAEGWVPTEQYEEVREELENASQGSIYIEKLGEDEDAPVAHDNPGGVQPLESLLDLYGTPSYSEVDPTFLLLTFPILFGLMLGDVGYGITTFAVFYGMYRVAPAAKGLWYSLMYASVATVAFGLVYGEMFGYIIFGQDSVLAELTGLHIFQQIPILFHRVHHLPTVLQLSVLIGVVHVNLGYLVGAYNEYLHHGVKEAVLAKLSWLVVQAGGVLWYVTGSAALGGGVLLLGVVMLALGEGVEGVVEIPSLLSNILSYLRIFGVVMAIVVLAAVVNTLAEPLFQSGSIVMTALGVGVLVVGHTFNTFLKMMEAGLQGIRLHYVEFFTKFFEGGGEYYRPFGGEKV